MKKMLIDFSAHVIRTAILEDGILTDLILDSQTHRSLVGNIYVGVVKNILPSQFVFVDIGEEKNAFLQLNDPKEQYLYAAQKNGAKKLTLKQGQELLVQVVKDAAGTKGANITSQLSFTGKLLVLITNSLEQDIGVSKKIDDFTERSRLKKIASRSLPKEYSLIMRTNCKDQPEEVIQEELTQLIALHQTIIERGKYVKGGLPVHKEDYVIARTIKELLSDDLDEIIVNDEQQCAPISTVVAQYTNHPIPLSVHTEPTLLFNHYGLETMIQKLLHKKIWLRSGGFLTIEQTEACVVIDVNTGKYEGKKNHHETILKTNMEAAVEICRQLKLRNLSGMIIIDFIDMKNPKDISALSDLVLSELKKDRISTNIVGMTQLGLMQLTRKKTREPLSNILEIHCPHCNGSGKIASPMYTADQIYKKIDFILSNSIFNRITIEASEKVIRLFKGSTNFYTTLCKKYEAEILLQVLKNGSDDYYSIEKEKI